MAIFTAEKKKKSKEVAYCGEIKRFQALCVSLSGIWPYHLFISPGSDFSLENIHFLSLPRMPEIHGVTGLAL